MLLRFLSGVLCIALLMSASLSPLAATPAYEVLSFDNLPGWRSDNQSDALNAFRRSCARIMKLAPDAPLDATTATGFYGAARDWRGPCTQAASVRSGAGPARVFFERWFLPVSFSDDKTGLFTGYYEPEYRGALKQGGVYQTPILSIPADYRPDAPYYTRTDIETGKVDAKRYAIVWLADPVDAFFLHVQGSGRIRLEGGRTLRVGFAAKNNRPYTAIGRVLLQQGVLKPGQVSMQTIRAWLEAHPAQETALLRKNDSYVFFRVLTDVPLELGPLGSEGIHLTPGRSLAVDRRFHPMGSPVWLDASAVPVPFNKDANKPLQRLLIAQDAGTAIAGRQRGDVFWGAGPEAADVAGRMQSPGTLVALVPRSALGKE